MDTDLDVLAWSLTKAKEHLKVKGYECIYTELPVVKNKKSENGRYIKYVVRQELLEDKITFNLFICSKFRKEVQ